jgi:hypothetical protein
MVFSRSFNRALLVVGAATVSVVGVVTLAPRVDGSSRPTTSELMASDGLHDNAQYVAVENTIACLREHGVDVVGPLETSDPSFWTYSVRSEASSTDTERVRSLDTDCSEKHMTPIINLLEPEVLSRKQAEQAVEEFQACLDRGGIEAADSLNHALSQEQVFDLFERAAETDAQLAARCAGDAGLARTVTYG